MGFDGGGFSKLGIVCAEHGVMEPYLPFVDFWGGGVAGSAWSARLAGSGGVRADNKKPATMGGFAKQSGVCCGSVDYALGFAPVIVINKIDLGVVVHAVQRGCEFVQVGALAGGFAYLRAHGFELFAVGFVLI